MLRAPKVLLYFFLLLHAVSFYHRKILLLCPLPLMKYCSSFLFSLLRSRFLPGTGFSRPAQSISERLFVSSGGFLSAFKVKVCWHCASVAKMDGAVLGRSKAQIAGRSARPPTQWPHCHFKLFFLTQALLILPAADMLWFGKRPELGMFNIIIIFLTV